jgi:antitoxin VapB
MPLNIKNPEVERLIDEITALTGESKTEAVRKALLDRKSRIRLRAVEEGRKERLMRFLEEEVWPKVPAEELGRRLSREEEESILGYGEEGV